MGRGAQISRFDQRLLSGVGVGQRRRHVPIFELIGSRAHAVRNRMRQQFALSSLAAGALVLAGVACADAAEEVLPAVEPSNALRFETLALRIPKDRLVSFSGIVSFDAAGNRPGYMLYP